MIRFWNILFGHEHKYIRHFYNHYNLEIFRSISEKNVTTYHHHVFAAPSDQRSLSMAANCKWILKQDTLSIPCPGRTGEWWLLGGRFWQEQELSARRKDCQAQEWGWCTWTEMRLSLWETILTFWWTKKIVLCFDQVMRNYFTILQATKKTQADSSAPTQCSSVLVSFLNVHT